MVSHMVRHMWWHTYHKQSRHQGKGRYWRKRWEFHHAKIVNPPRQYTIPISVQFLLCAGRAAPHLLPILPADLLDEPEERDERVSYGLEPDEPLASLSCPSPPSCLLCLIPTVQSAEGPESGQRTPSSSSESQVPRTVPGEGPRLVGWVGDEWAVRSAFKGGIDETSVPSFSATSVGSEAPR